MARDMEARESAMVERAFTWVRVRVRVRVGVRVRVRVRVGVRGTFHVCKLKEQGCMVFL